MRKVPVVTTVLLVTMLPALITAVAAQVDREDIAVGSGELDEVAKAEAVAGDAVDGEQRAGAGGAEAVDVQAHGRTLAVVRRRTRLRRRSDKLG